MSLSVHTNILGATRTVTRPQQGTLTVQFHRLLPSGATITGGATITRNKDGGATMTVARCGPGGRAGDRSWEISPQR